MNNCRDCKYVEEIPHRNKGAAAITRKCINPLSGHTVVTGAYGCKHHKRRTERVCGRCANFDHIGSLYGRCVIEDQMQPADFTGCEDFKWRTNGQ